MWNPRLKVSAHDFFGVVEVGVAPATDLEAEPPIRRHQRETQRLKHEHRLQEN